MSRLLQGHADNRVVHCILLMFLGSVACAALPSDCDDVCRASHLLYMLHPELSRDSDVYLRSTFPLFPTRNLTSFSVTVRKPIAHHDIDYPAGALSEEKLKTLYPPLLTATFDFTVKSHIVATMHVEGSEYEKLRAVRNLVESHAEWSDEQVLAALKDAGAKYIDARKDREGLLKILPVKQLEEYLGTITITKTDLSLRSVGGQDGSLVNASLNWVISFTAQGNEMKARRYWMTVDPFEGRVTSIQTTDF